MSIRPVNRFELASRIVLDEPTSSWFIVGVGGEDEVSLLSEELAALTGSQVPVRQVSDRETLVIAARETAAVLSVYHAKAMIESLDLDGVRSSLRRPHAAVLAVPADQLSRVPTVAPHFMSWAGNRLFMVADDRFLDTAAREERLTALRGHYQVSDDEFLARVKQGSMGSEPEHAEWLVLLGRPDLLDGEG